MLRSRTLRLVAAALLALPYFSAFAQTPSELRAAVDGTSLPNKLTPEQLTDEYWPVNLTLSGVAMDAMSLGLRFAVIGNLGGSDSTQHQLWKAMQVSWTKGQMVRLGSSDFLATYRIDADPVAMSMNAAERYLSLVLVKPDAITSVGAVPGYTRQQFLEAIGVRTGSPAQTASDRTRTLSNVKQAGLAIHLYASDYDDEIPYVQSTRSLQGVVHPYTKNMEIWQTYNPNGGRILFNMSLAGANLASVPRPSETPMLFDEKEWPDGSRVVAYADGHAKVVSREEWQRMHALLQLKLKRQKRPLPADYPPGLFSPAGSPYEIR